MLFVVCIVIFYVILKYVVVYCVDIECMNLIDFIVVVMYCDFYFYYVVFVDGLLFVFDVMFGLWVVSCVMVVMVVFGDLVCCVCLFDVLVLFVLCGMMVGVLFGELVCMNEGVL